MSWLLASPWPWHRAVSCISCGAYLNINNRFYSYLSTCTYRALDIDMRGCCMEIAHKHPPPSQAQPAHRTTTNSTYCLPRSPISITGFTRTYRDIDITLTLDIDMRGCCMEIPHKHSVSSLPSATSPQYCLCYIKIIYYTTTNSTYCLPRFRCRCRCSSRIEYLELELELSQPSPGVHFWLYPVFEAVRYDEIHSWIQQIQLGSYS